MPLFLVATTTSRIIIIADWGLYYCTL